MNKKEFANKFSDEIKNVLKNLYSGGIKSSSFTTDEFNDKNRIFANFKDFNDVFVDLEYYREKKDDTVKLTLEITTSNDVIIQKLIERFEDNFTKEGEE